MYPLTVNGLERCMRESGWPLQAIIHCFGEKILILAKFLHCFQDVDVWAFPVLPRAEGTGGYSVEADIRTNMAKRPFTVR